MSRKIAPLMLKLEEFPPSTARRWEMRAPLSWPPIIIGTSFSWERWERRALRIASPVLRLSCAPGRGEERP